MSLVEVRRIEKDRWHGKKGKEDFSQPITIECLYDPKTGKYATGLNEQDQERLEKATGKDLSNTHDINKPHPFWGSNTAKIKLNSGTTIFDTKNPYDEIKVKVLKKSRFIANSVRELEDGLWPEATHVIYDENEEMARKASKIQVRNQARELAMKMSPDEKANIVQILREKSVRNQSQNYIDVEIETAIDERPNDFIRVAKEDKKETYLRASILEGIHRNILTKEGNNILYMGDQIGDSVSGAVKYFLDPNNQQIKAKMLEKITE